MKKLEQVFIVATLAFGVIGLVGIAEPASAETFNQTVRVTTPMREELVDFNVAGLSGAGVSGDPYITYNSTVPLRVSATGVGRLTIATASGDVLWTYDKTDPTFTTLTANITLPNGVGLYDLIATMTDPADANNVYGTKDVWVLWKATPIGPELPGGSDSGDDSLSAPGTGLGYLYIGGRAFAVSSVLLDLALVVGLAGLVVFVVRKRKERANER